MLLKDIETVSFASKHSKATSRTTMYLKAESNSISDSFDTQVVVSGMFAEPLLVTQWLNEHVLLIRPELGEKLISLVEKVKQLNKLDYDTLSNEDKNLIVMLTGFNIYEGETQISVSQFCEPTLNALNRLGLLDFKAVTVATASKNITSKIYLIHYLV